MLLGLEKAFRILAAAGADRLFTLHSKQLLVCDRPPQRQQSAAAAAAAAVAAVAGAQQQPAAAEEERAARQRFEQFLAEVAAAGTASNTLGLFSAHQMGTCRLGSSPRTSAADCDGELWCALVPDCNFGPPGHRLALAGAAAPN
jgi:choline dehydrogenase-like flavoprotein